MQLLPSQKNELYDLILAFNLSPSQFDFSYEYGSVSTREMTPYIRFKSTDYYYILEYLHQSYYIQFSPGEEKLTDHGELENWQHNIICFQNWLEYLKREINQPDKWERLHTEMQGIRINFKNDEDAFSIKEHDELSTKLKLIKDGLRKIELSSDQANSINEKLDHLLVLAKEMNKFDWKSLFIGTIFSIIIQLSVTPSSAKSLIDLIKGVFKNYILP